MAGTIPLSLTQQLDEFGKPLSGGLLYIIQAGTVATPQQPYQDVGLTILQPNPIPLDAAGRIPQFFVADGFIKFRLVDKNGVTQMSRDGVLVIGPSSGGGGGGTVDPTTLIQTGMLSMFYGTGVVAGYVRANARTIGNAGSGATERANADTQALWVFLYNADPNLAVSGGRGASALADYNAGKQLTLPDWRGRTLAGLDDMGNVAAGRLTLAAFGQSPTQLGAAGGVETKTSVIGTANLPPYTPAGNIGNTYNVPGGGEICRRVVSHNSVGPLGYGGTANGANISAADLTVTSTFTGTPQGGSSTPLPVVVTQPTMLATIYLKL